MRKTEADRLRWLVFGDDWGRHPSTTQHLVRELLQADRVVWVGSIGMRAPQLRWTDFRRVAEKLLRPARSAASEPAAENQSPTLLRLTMLPWHHFRWVRHINRWLLARALGRAGETAPFDMLLYSNPIAVNYLPHGQTPAAYLRLDDYHKLPGVNPAWIERFEPLAMRRAKCVFATAKKLLPENDLDAQAVYLPQGVEYQRFAEIALQPPDTRVVGFFGLIEAWVDFELIAAAARALPDWQFEFIGHAAVWPEAMAELPNVKMLGPRPYAELPAAIAHWRGAWVPFVINELTLAVNPVKLREYLAAGLPSFCTPLPEAKMLGEWVQIGDSADAVQSWCEELLRDTMPNRQARRDAMSTQGWNARARQLREAMLK